jgi:hypothetical protein
MQGHFLIYYLYTYFLLYARTSKGMRINILFITVHYYSYFNNAVNTFISYCTHTQIGTFI